MAFLGYFILFTVLQAVISMGAVMISFLFAEPPNPAMPGESFGGALLLACALYSSPILGLIWTCLYRFRAKPPGHYLTCGYNLTGLTEPRCPECGKAFDRADSQEQVNGGLD